MKRFGFLVLLPLLFPVVAWAQGSTNTLPPACSAATLLTVCVPQVEGVRARVFDAASATVCTGGGSTTVVCEYDGSAWFALNNTGSGFTWTGANGETMDNSTDGQFSFTTNGTNTPVIIKGIDSSGATDTTYDTNSVGNINLGSSDVATVELFTTGIDLTLETNGNGNASFSTAGASTGSVILDFRDYADTIDDDMAHAILATNCTTVSTGAEDCDLTISTTEAGSNEIRIVIVGDGDIDLTGGDVKLPVEETATFGAPNKMTATSSGLNQYIGIPRLNVTHIATLTDGGTSTAVANPLLANCNAVVNGTETDDTNFFITGSSSYKYVWPGTVAADDGIDCVINYPAVTDPIRLGFWFRSDTAITSGDIDINFDDGGVTDGTISTFSTSVVDEWQWIELDITSACSSDCSAVDGIEFLATAQAASGTDLDGVSMYIDQLAMWKAADEKAIGDIQVGGLIDFAYAAKAAGTANTPTEGVEWTSHFITYQSGADAIISITDLSAQYGTTLEALND